MSVEERWRITDRCRGASCALIAPVYPKTGDGRPPKELEMMLRVYFNLSDPGVKEAVQASGK